MKTSAKKTATPKKQTAKPTKAQPSVPQADPPPPPAKIRKGCILISAEVVERNYEMLAKSVFSHFVPLAITVHPDRPEILIYAGLCKDFEEVDAAAPVPRYLADVKIGNGGTSVKFIRQTAATGG